MLDKDQYNQEDYNNYYKQESEGAEIKGYAGEEGGLKSKLMIFAGLIGLAIAGYFGFKMLNSQDTVNTSMPTEEKLAVNEEPTKEDPVSSSTSSTEESPSKTVAKEAVATKQTVAEVKAETIKEEVASQIEGKKDMSDQDISKIVDLVMNKMEKTQTDDSKENIDNALMSALQETEQEAKPVEKAPEVKANSVVHEMKEVTDSYNKVTVKASSDKNLDELSDQIRKLLNMAGEPVNSTKSVSTTASTSTATLSQVTENDGNSNYAKSISKEIETRSKEMRIIIVKQGDTLNKIAKRAYGNSKSFQKIFDANPDILNRADRIYVGQKLRIPE